MTKIKKILALSIGISVLLHSVAMADEIRVAVASNFLTAMIPISKLFESSTNNKVKLISGSTGKLYAQIKNGAPYDVFFAADAYRPELLEQQNATVSGSRFTYAMGKIILWSADDTYLSNNNDIVSKIRSGKLAFKWFAIANPRLAPYGVAAKEVLLKYNLWESLTGRIVQGESISQTLQFIKSRNAQLGFIAYSQTKSPRQAIKGSYWAVPQSDYTPIIQQAVLLKDNKVAREFLLFFKSKKTLQLISDYGYDIP